MKQFRNITSFFAIIWIKIANAQSAYMREVQEDAFADGGKSIPNILYIAMFFGAVYIFSKIQDLFDEIKDNKISKKRNQQNTTIKHPQEEIIEKVHKQTDNTKIIIQQHSSSITPTLNNKEYAHKNNQDDVKVEDYKISSDGKIFIKFNDNNIEDIDIPYGIETIKDGAFAGTKQLKRVRLPKSIVKIESFAFSCSSIKSIFIPNSVKQFGNQVFWGCKNLETIELESGITHLGAGFLQYCRALTHIKLPNTLQAIPHSCFKDCASLEYICIPDSVIEIGDMSFNGCKALKTVILPKNILSINDYVFSGATQLNIELPQSITCIMSYAFENCNNLKIKLPSTLTHIESDAFLHCDDAEIWVCKGKKQWLENNIEHCNGKIIEYDDEPIVELPKELLDKTETFLSNYYGESEKRLDKFLDSYY